jgi:hypothetical protein
MTYIFDEPKLAEIFYKNKKLRYLEIKKGI